MHDKEKVQQTVRKETGRSVNSEQRAGQMGSGALSNAIGAWTSSGIFVSRSRAGRVDESVDVGAQANPSGVYPIMQPMAYLPRSQRPPSAPSHVLRGSSDSDSQKQQNAAGRVAAATNPRPERSHPTAAGPGMQHLPHEAVYSRPVSAPAGTLFNPGSGAFKRPPPPPPPSHSPGVGLRRSSNTAAARGKSGSAVVGAGASKAAIRAAARAVAAASVLSAVADSRKTEARAAAAVAAARAMAGAGAAAAAATAAGPTELETG